MKIDIKPGRYTLALSGGVDSTVLLDVLSEISSIDLIIAHFDHGIRHDSIKDQEFCKKLAEKYKLPFYFEKGILGENASEAKARAARYKFLNEVKDKTQSQAIITAHHQDDLIETAIINMLRGTSYKGLSALKSTSKIIRPMLGISKKQILAYARKNNLLWREDPTNQETKYLRNLVRSRLSATLTPSKRAKLLVLLDSSAASSEQIDKLLTAFLPAGNKLARQHFINLPHEVSKKLLAEWLRRLGLRLDRKTLERLVINIKTIRPGRRIEINNNFYFSVEKENVVVNKR